MRWSQILKQLAGRHDFRSTGTLRSCHEELAVQNRKADICPTAGEMVFFVIKILEAPR